MTDIWVCSTCHSINRQRDDRCYKCGAKQEQATGALADMRTERAIQTRAMVRYRTSLPWAIIAAAFILAVAVLGVVVLNESLIAVRYFRDQIPVVLQTGQVDEAEFIRQAAGAIVPGLLRLASSLGALLFFAAWLSRVTANIPALGGGTPGATPTKAFIYPLIPIVNLFRVPPMIQDALYRLDPKAGGFFMILLAWVGLVGSAIVAFILGWWVDLRMASVIRNADTLGDAIAGVQGAYDLQVIVDIVTTLMVSAGAIVLVLVMFRIETRALRRNREIVRAFAAATTGPGTVPAPPAASPSVAPAAPAAPAPPSPAADDLRRIGTTVSATSLGSAPVAFWSPADEPPSGPPPGTGPVERTGPATAIGPADPGSGPRLLVRVSATGVLASLDGDAFEPSTAAELHQASPALAAAGGSAVVTADDATDAAAASLAEISGLLRASGVPTSIG